MGPTQAHPERRPLTDSTRLPDPGRLLLTVEEAAERLRIGRTIAFELVASGQLDSIKIGRLRRVPVDALHQFIESLGRPPRP